GFSAAHLARPRRDCSFVPAFRADAADSGCGCGSLPFRMRARETFRFPVRVYYEDTDAAGVVYYANYLKFMERARTEWLSALGFDLAAIEREHGIVFVVHRVEVDFRAPAQLSDRLDVTMTLTELGRASIESDA